MPHSPDNKRMVVHDHILHPVMRAEIHGNWVCKVIAKFRSKNLHYRWRLKERPRPTSNSRPKELRQIFCACKHSTAPNILPCNCACTHVRAHAGTYMHAKASLHHPPRTPSFHTRTKDTYLGFAPLKYSCNKEKVTAGIQRLIKNTTIGTTILSQYSA